VTLLRAPLLRRTRIGDETQLLRSCPARLGRRRQSSTISTPRRRFSVRLRQFRECQRRSFKLPVLDHVHFYILGSKAADAKLNYNDKPSSATGCDFALRLRQMEAEMRVILCSVLAAGVLVVGCNRSDAATSRDARATPAAARAAGARSVATAGRPEGARAAEPPRWQKPRARSPSPPARCWRSHSIRPSAPTPAHVEQASRAHLTRSIHVEVDGSDRRLRVSGA